MSYPLTVSRRVGQSILIGTNCKITLLHVDKEQARIEVDCPLGVSIYMEESLTQLDGSRRQGEVADHKEDKSTEDDQTLLMKMEDRQ